MSSYSLNCSVCNGEYDSKADWLRHLTDKHHQILARKECIEQQWNVKSVKECCLVVFSSFPLTSSTGGGGGDKIVQYFSSNLSTFVTDFVWWEERDRIGVLQFESRTKVKDTLSSCLEDGSADVLIDNQKAQIKWAMDLLDLEWNAIIPGVGSVRQSPIPSALSSMEKALPPGKHLSSFPARIDTGNTTVQVAQHTDESESSEDASTKEHELDAVTRLRELARQRQWNMPKFRIFLDTSLKTSKYWCSVLLNGVIYTPTGTGAKTQKDAREISAAFCLEAVASEPFTPPVQENYHDVDNSDTDASSVGSKSKSVRKKRSLESDPEEENDVVGNPSKKQKTEYVEVASKINTNNNNAVSSLVELVQFRKYPQPKFSFSQSGPVFALKFVCTVTVNQIDYKPEVSTIPKWATKTKKEAKNFAAAYCLQQLTPSKTSSVIIKQNEEEGELDFKYESNDEASKSFSSSPRQSVLSTSVESLQYQLWRLCKSIRVPDHEYTEKVLNVKDALRSLFSLNDPTAEVAIFRNWYLKLRNPVSIRDEDILLVYVYNTRSQPDFPSSFTWLTDSTVSQVFSLPQAQKCFSVLEAVDSDSYGREQLGWKVKYKPSRVTFQLLIYKRFFMEVQICRLLEYMCTFDPRSQQLLALAYHWSSVNSAQVGEIEPNGRNVHLNLPEPLSLQWLVMTFLCHKEIIPTPREIQQRPHDTLHDRLTGIDVGFHADPEFVEKWKSKRKRVDPNTYLEDEHCNEEYIQSVIVLFQEFLEFCGNTLDSSNWILNTRDGEVISSEKFLAGDPNSKLGHSDAASLWSTKMTKTELATLRSLQRFPAPDRKAENEGSVAIQGNYKVNFKEWKIYMVHPFLFNCKFSISKDIRLVFKKMRECGLQLKKFLNMRKSNGVEPARRRFGTLENVLKSD